MNALGLWVCEGSAIEMGWSSVNAEVRPNNSAECSTRQYVTIRPAELRQTNSASLAALLSRYFAVPPALYWTHYLLLVIS